MGNRTHYKVRPAQAFDRDQLAAMRVLLWPDGSFEEHAAELDVAIESRRSGTLPGEILVAQDEDGTLIGFLEAGLRSHADGCDPARPAGYVEGWYVLEGHRERGIGKELLCAAEEWARTQGCAEMASDALIDNHQSQAVHQALGFEVVDRCVRFRKSL